MKKDKRMKKEVPRIYIHERVHVCVLDVSVGEDRTKEYSGEKGRECIFAPLFIISHYYLQDGIQFPAIIDMFQRLEVEEKRKLWGE